MVNLQDSVQMSEESSIEREDKLRHEIMTMRHKIMTMRHKLEESDRRQEDMSDCESQATKPVFFTSPSIK